MPSYSGFLVRIIFALSAKYNFLRMHNYTYILLCVCIIMRTYPEDFPLSAHAPMNMSYTPTRDPIFQWLE